MSLARKTPLRRTGRLPAMSSKRRSTSRVYSKRRKVFLAAHPECQVMKEVFGHYRASTEIHHKAGRVGPNYLDESTWLAVSREGHDFIHNNPSKARRLGYLT